MSEIIKSRIVTLAKFYASFVGLAISVNHLFFKGDSLLAAFLGMVVASLAICGIVLYVQSRKD